MFAAPALDADASRPRSSASAPSPSPQGSLGRDHGARSASPGHKDKEKPDVAAMEHLLKPSIAIKPHPPKLHVLPRILLPLMLLPRVYLPLACIDLAAYSHDPPLSRFYESHAKILEPESRFGSAPSVLLAYNESSGTTYAIERQDDGLYVVCRLGSWVDLAFLATKATALSHHRLRLAKPPPKVENATVALTTPRIYNENKKKRAAIEAIQSLVKKRARSQSVSRFEDADNLDTTEMDTGRNRLSDAVKKSEQEAEPSLSSISPAPATILRPDGPSNSPKAIFDNVRQQYFDALYKSIGSLAYFAKGPLSRARSAFHLDLDSNLDMAQLIAFLKSLILTTVQIDKKYRETIPNVIFETRDHVGSSDENRKRRRRERKLKIGTDGLYPLEDETVRQWWNATRPELGRDQDNHSASQAKLHVSLLRTRETQLQMIVILETMALERLTTATEAGESSLPQIPGAESRTHMQPVAALPQHKRNKHNFPLLIDVHADRLTIWQSTASDEQLLLEDSQVPQGLADGQVQQKTSAEPLRDFCTDIIIPLFSACLPELCDTISRKLGGPVIPSRPKPRSSKHAPGKREQKPGAAAKRPTPVNDSRRTLQRALSTDQQHRRSVSRGPGNAIALMRSSASVTTVKRESSEPAPMRTQFRGESRASQWKQPLLSRSASASNAADGKAEKKAMVEAELKDAISALRKPNRDVVCKAMTEAEEHRAGTNSSAKSQYARALWRSTRLTSSRLEAKKGSRDRLASSIQVRATPMNNKFRDVLVTRAECSKGLPLDRTEDLISPSSIGNLVPSTGLRERHMNALSKNLSPAVELVRSTPFRPLADTGITRRRITGPLTMPPSSPLTEAHVTRPTRLQLAVESAPLTHEWVGCSALWREQVAATPVHGGTPRPEVDMSPCPATRRPPVRMSIYQKLGWDDDYDALG